MRDYDGSAAGPWEELVERGPMGTLLHTRAFLGYHGDRFTEASITIHDDGGALVGVMPAAVDPQDPACAASHPGATFGGIVHDGSLRGEAMVAALEGVVAHLRERGFTRLRYSPVPPIYHVRPSADDLHALFRAGAARTRCELSCAVDLELGARLSPRRRRGLARSAREGVELSEGAALARELWPVLEANLAERHGARPVHSVSEIETLLGLFPERILVVLARLRRQAVAGAVLFESARVSHAQYIASTDEGRSVGALDAVFTHCLSRASERGARYFDFGTSSAPNGALNAGLYEFKAQFGGGGAAYERYELYLSTAAPKPVAP